MLAILREEAYYFAPQGQTKIMNEGWASYWHSTIMTRKALTADEIIDYADHHSGTHGHAARRAEPVQARHRALPRHRGAVEQGPVRQGMGRVRRPEGPPRLGQEPGPRAGEDLRGPQALQRRHLHRHLPHCRVRDGAEAVRLRLQREAEQLGDPRPRVPQGEEQAAQPAHQLRAAHHRGGGRQLREPGRAAPGPQARRAGPQAATTRARRSGTSRPSGAGPATSSPRSRGRACACVSTVRTRPRRRWSSEPVAHALVGGGPRPPPHRHPGRAGPGGGGREPARASAVLARRRRGDIRRSRASSSGPWPRGWRRRAWWSGTIRRPASPSGCWRRSSSATAEISSSSSPGTARPSRASCASSRARRPPPPGRAASAGAPALGTAEEKEIRRLLDEARRHWEEYQRLKAGAGKADTP